jgi:hypothetical protein
MWEPRRLTTLWASTAYYRNNFISITTIIIIIIIIIIIASIISETVILGYTSRFVMCKVRPMENYLSKP